MVDIGLGLSNGMSAVGIYLVRVLLSQIVVSLAIVYHVH